MSKKVKPSDKPEYKSFSYFSYDKLNNDIFYKLGKISKNVYNLGLYSIQIFNLFKIRLYKKLYNKLLENNKFDFDKYIKNKLEYYFDLYSSLKNNLKDNNKYIYKYIIEYIKENNIIIKNSNYDYYTKYFIKKLKNNSNIFLNGKNDKLLLNDIIIRIISSIYIKNFNIIKDCLLYHKSFPFEDNELINDVKNNNFINILEKNIYKDKIQKELNIKLKSDQNYISCLAYSKLGNNHGKLESTMICNIITKAYNSYSSYYALLDKGIKANRPKFLDKNSLFNLQYVFNKMVKNNENDNIVKGYTSNYIANNFNKVFGENYICLSKYKYIDSKYLKNIKGKIIKKYNYFINDKYIEKTNKNIVDSRYILFNIPNKANHLDITMIEIIFINNMIKISLVYKTHNIKSQEIEINSNDSISIDLGMKNLLTIYNPSGEQKIIDGKFISSINTYYNKLIGNAQSKNNKRLFNKYTMKRMFIINNYFNKIVKWLENEYSNKKLVILGYNKEWKQNTNMGKNNNMKFNKIPYMKLINKIKTRFGELNKYIVLTEESYTSKCDSLALEKISKHENYLGKRTKRGLFESSKGKLINADLNGAINIMRKVFKLEKITGLKICNPSRVKIFREVKPADKSIIVIH